MEDWWDAWKGKLLMLAGLGVILLGGVQWPPGDISLTDIVLGLTWIYCGARWNGPTERGEAQHKHETVQQKRAAEAFANHWADAPKATIDWISGLPDDAYASLQSWTETSVIELQFQEDSRAMRVEWMTPPLPEAEKARLLNLSEHDLRRLEAVLRAAR